jgi:hypothetical protein
MKADRVRVQLSELAAPIVTVPQWETPILKAVHGENDVRVLETVELDRDPPDAADEYRRLANLYRGEGNSPVVAEVYGQHGAGVSQLAAAIAKASEPAKKPAAK